MATVRFKDHILGPDTHTNRPAASGSGVPASALYECTTHGLIYKNVAGTWVTYGVLVPPGGTTGQVLTKNSGTDGDVGWSAGGGGGGVGDHGSRVKKDGTPQAFASGSVLAVTWQTENYDTDGYWTSGAPTRMTIPTGMAGRYTVGGGFTFDNATGFDQLISIALNGTEIPSTRNRGASAFAHLRTSTILDLAVGDYVEFMGYQGSGTSKSTSSTANMCEFWLQKMT